MKKGRTVSAAFQVWWDRGCAGTVHPRNRWFQVHVSSFLIRECRWAMRWRCSRYRGRSRDSASTPPAGNSCFHPDSSPDCLCRRGWTGPASGRSRRGCRPCSGRHWLRWAIPAQSIPIFNFSFNTNAFRRLFSNLFRILFRIIARKPVVVRNKKFFYLCYVCIESYKQLYQLTTAYYFFLSIAFCMLFSNLSAISFPYLSI